MASLLFRKSIYGVLVLLGVVMAVFLLFQGIGDPARLVMGQTGDSTTLSNIRKELHLDKPRHTQLLLYVNDISPICIHRAGEIEAKGLRGFFIGGEWKAGLKVPYLRRSYQSKKEVWQILMEALPGTLLLAVAAMLIATCAGIPLGVAAATRQHGWTDRIATFFMGIVVAYLFGFVWQSYTGLRMTGSLYDLDPFQGKVLQLQNLMLPALTLGIRPLAIVTQLTRSAMLDVLKQDYIRTARAKGLTQRAVVWRHALPNALNPVMTSVTGWFAELLAGAFFVEYIFGWKGLGKVTVDALEKLDYPVVMGSIILTALLFVVVNMLADLLYSKLDPRIGRG
jgi:peptide/nickel transport system permease protein